MAPVRRVAVIQWNIQDLAIEENHQTACAHIRTAAEQGAELAVLPEYHLTGWSPSDPLWTTLAHPSTTTRYLKAYQDLARALHICIVPGTIIESQPSPSAHRGGGSEAGIQSPHLYNTAYFISTDGSILGRYRKKNIWHPERAFLTSSGEEPHEVFDTPIGRVGLLICWDLAFPEAFRELLVQGVEVVVVPTYWSKYDASPTALTHNPSSESLFLESTLTARCFENTCGIVFANVARGDETSDRFLGLSRVCLPIVGTVGVMGSEEGVLVVDMDLGVVRVAEENYKVREDLLREGWYYSYRHQRGEKSSLKGEIEGEGGVRYV
ncbi:carbon-nitrogen hydrolase [Aspergillus heteromorphus CBS 117.55]|uniref:Carbon-nitrogen hydrolase n=1 Tax=Aspergillus heteromorphus CBS 117.55 TaxID=1448321 RepID=A0A317X1H2_9EURO|nr:carbon-nitrogen hydrolase [Aspergillus heteromorphus CBS 117.55]PWY92175.1 carbon-nitrogen hydrolase [Aspergillus heteromorphus CBS 117.55]